jgi:GNAT superfamily N-acetyltransferase
VHIRSLALKTELALAETRGVVIDRGDYIVIQTPDDPGYYFGNLLVMSAAPQAGDLARWTELFREELADPEIRHVAFRWDGPDIGAAQDLTAAGFAVDVSSVMTAHAIAAPAIALELRELAPHEVRATADLRWTMSDRHDDRYRKFLQRRAAWQRDLVTRDLARFWGVFDDQQLVGSLGLASVAGLSRYQDVQTAASHRGRGIASALLATAAAAATGELVIIAEPNSIAARVYERAGFRAVEQSATACRRPT